MELYVDIKKKLPDFNLEVKFHTDTGIMGLLGESGSGKSMTLKCIAGLVTPDRGKIVLKDKVIFDSERGINMPVKERRIGFVFQNYALFPNMNVEDNIGYALNKLSKSERRKTVEEYIEMMQLNDLRKRCPHQLSGGQQQRVALARALAIKPEVVLLDEPFSALDNHLRSLMVKQMADVLNNYHGVTIFITHNMDEAYQLCEKLVVLSEGQEKGSGLKETMFNNPPTVTAARLTGCKNISPVRQTSKDTVEARDWNCSIKVRNRGLSRVTHVGIRAHCIKLAEEGCENSISCWPSFISEIPFRKMIFLKLHTKPMGKADYQLIWDISDRQWEKIRNMPLPWKIHIDPENIIIINDNYGRT